MSPDNFNSAFADTMSSQLPLPPHDPRYLAFELMRRDHSRSRVLAVLSIFFWLVGVAGMMLLVVGLYDFVLYVRISNFEANGPYTVQAATRPDWQDTNHRMAMLWDGTNLIHHTLPYIGGGMVSLLLGAIFTVMLVFSSRRATLNRINLSLIQISEEMKQMRQSRPQGTGQ